MIRPLVRLNCSGNAFAHRPFHRAHPEEKTVFVRGRMPVVLKCARNREYAISGSREFFRAVIGGFGFQKGCTLGSP